MLRPRTRTQDNTALHDSVLHNLQRVGGMIPGGLKADDFRNLLLGGLGAPSLRPKLPKYCPTTLDPHEPPDHCPYCRSKNWDSHGNPV